MKFWLKFLWGIVGIIALGILAICSYGIGEDWLEWLPLYLTKCILGLFFLIIGTIILSIFALGIIKIREMIRGE